MVTELEMLREWKNHAEFREKLKKLGLTGNLDVLEGHVDKITRGWLQLGEAHLAEAQSAWERRLARTTYSRAYYAAYNASKAVRFRVIGFVSMSGDDHKKAVDLPRDFPDADTWFKTLGELYQHRLRADYDNWALTQTEQIMAPERCVALAADFVASAKQYLIDKFGEKV